MTYPVLKEAPRTLFTPQAVKAAMGAKTAAWPKLDLLNIELVKRPLYIEDETPNKIMDGIVMPIPMDQQSAIVRKDTGEAIHFAGKDYRIVQMQELHEAIESATRMAMPPHVHASVKLSEKISNMNFFRAEYRFPSLGAAIQHPTGEMIRVELDVRVENQATHSVKVAVGARDTFCDNAMVFDASSVWSKGHTNSFSTDGLQQFIGKEVADFGLRIAQLREWNATAISETDFTVLLHQSGLISDNFQTKIIEQFSDEVNTRGQTKLAAYSALTAFCTHNNERFYVKDSANKDNEAVGMSQREDFVRKIVSSTAWKDWS